MTAIFPVIRTLNDVLPAIQGRKEFSVIEQEHYTVIDYNIQIEDTFDTTPNGLLRRECRGIMFSKDGKILSRPFHKFFNLGEREETLPENLNFNDYYKIQEKIDGSMVRPVFLDGEFHFATRKGVTDVALAAREVFIKLDKDNLMLQCLIQWINIGYTPILEYIGPENRIVISYDRSDLVLLALRNNEYGSYRDGDMIDRKFHSIYDIYPGSSVIEHFMSGQSHDFKSYIERVRKDEGREGDVVVFLDGYRIKIKSEWYVNLHRIKDEIGRERFIALKALDNTLDDALGLLSEADQKDIKEIAEQFLQAYSAKLVDINRNITNMMQWVESRDDKNSRKAIALEFIPTLKNKKDAKYLYAFLDEKSVEDVFNQDVRDRLNKESRYNELCKWFKMLN